MTAKLKKVLLIIAGGTLVGGILGLLIGTLLGNPALWMGVLAAGGGVFGVALAYGFLPER
jgi:hypothetical protein